MQKFYKFALSLLFLVIFSAISIAAEEIKLPPKKQKTKIANKIVLPTPFNRWNSCNLSSVMYPGFDCKNDSINDTSLGTINKVAIWEDAGRKYLLALFETFEAGAEDLPLSESGKDVDIALFDIKNNNLSLVASSKKVISYRWFGGSYVDSSQYKINTHEKVIGVRYVQGISGDPVGHEYLRLFRLKNNTLNEIFATNTVHAEFPKDYPENKTVIKVLSTVQVVGRTNGMNDLRIVSKGYRLNTESGNVKTKPSSTASETWSWDEKSEIYVRNNAQHALRP